MSIVENPKFGQGDLTALLEGLRPNSQKITLRLGGEALLINALFILSLTRSKEKEDGVELGITRNVRVPVTLVKWDRSVRSYGFIPQHEEEPLFAFLSLGFRPSRPFIFINGADYKATFEKDSPDSLSFTLESKRKMISHPLWRVIDYEKYMKELYEAGELSMEAEEEWLRNAACDVASEADVRANTEDQIRRYLAYSQDGHLTSEWRDWAARHKDQIEQFASVK